MSAIRGVGVLLLLSCMRLMLLAPPPSAGEGRLHDPGTPEVLLPLKVPKGGEGPGLEMICRMLEEIWASKQEVWGLMEQPEGSVRSSIILICSGSGSNVYEQQPN